MPKLPKRLSMEGKPKLGKSSKKVKKDDKKKSKKDDEKKKKSSKDDKKKKSKKKEVIIESSSSEEEEEEYVSSSSEEEYESSSGEEESDSSDDDRARRRNKKKSSSGTGGGAFQHADDYDPENALDAIIDSVIDYPDPTEGWDVVREWLQSHDFNETKSAIEYKGEFDTTALHVACRNRPPKDIIDVMIMAAPDMIFWADSFGWLPLHYACANGAEIDVVSALLEAYPDSKLTTDKRGRTPLHFALGNVDQPPTEQLVQLLAGKEMKSSSVRWPDENNMLPLHYACACK